MTATAHVVPHCPICGEPVQSTEAAFFGHPLRRCPRCTHSFLSVSTTEQLESLYGDHYAGFRDDPVFVREASRMMAAEIVPRIPPPARILDVGCGNGAFLSVAREAGYAALGIDVSAAAGEICQRRGLEARVGDFRSSAVIPEGEQFQLVAFWDVLEHLPSPAGFLARAHELLRPGGYVLIKTPLTSRGTVRISAAVPRLAGALLQVPEHVQFFRRDGLSRLLRDTGFAEQHWLEARPMRSRATGGGLRRRITRGVTRTIQTAMGDGNLLALARRT